MGKRKGRRSFKKREPDFPYSPTDEDTSVHPDKGPDEEDQEESESDRDEDALRKYMRDGEKYPIITRKEVIAYVRRIKEGQDVDEAKQRLVEGNLRLVVSIAKKYAGKGPKLEDLIQEGNMALMKAVDNYVYQKAHLSTYATWLIRGAILNAIGEHTKTRGGATHITVRGKKLSYSQVAKTRQALIIRNNKEPSNSKIAEEMAASTREWVSLSNEDKAKMVEEFAGAIEQFNPKEKPIDTDTIPEPPAKESSKYFSYSSNSREYTSTPEDLILIEEPYKFLNRAIEDCREASNPDHYRAHHMSLFEGRSYEEIGREFAVTGNRVRNWIHRFKECIGEKLKKYLKGSAYYEGWNI